MMWNLVARLLEIITNAAVDLFLDVLEKRFKEINKTVSDKIKTNVLKMYLVHV